jgi:DNA replication factor GINS
MLNMSLEDLVLMLTKERELDDLQEIGDSFYEDAASYIKKLEDSRTEATNYREADMLSDELKNARMVLEGVFDRRRSKIIDAALNTASGIKVDVKGITRKEKPMFDGIVAAIETGRNQILLPILEPYNRQNPAKNILGETATKEKPIENSLTHGGDLSEDLMMVKVLKDIPRFVGVDGRHYHLSSEDVVVLPKANALVLCNKNVAIPLENQQGQGLTL